MGIILVTPILYVLFLSYYKLFICVFKITRVLQKYSAITDEISIN